MKPLIISLLAITPCFRPLLAAKDKDELRPPELTSELREEIWRGQSEVNATMLAAERSREAQAARLAQFQWSAIAAKWATLCGDKFEPGSDSKTGKPVCVGKSIKDAAQPVKPKAP